MLIKEHYEQAARLLGVEPAVLRAVERVETGGKGGFLLQGKPRILFEGHVFWAQLKKKGKDPQRYVAGNEDILYPKWTRAWYRGGLEEWTRLERAMAIDEEAALMSASWGMFQVMGFNYAACGERSVRDFVSKMRTSEMEQLLLTTIFIRGNARMREALKAKDWAAFARLYNGPSYKSSRYDSKMAQAYEYYRARW